MMDDEHMLWKTRAFVYRHFADTGRSPSVSAAAEGLDLPAPVVERLYRDLNERHAFFLQPASDPPVVLMANPFSAVDTGFRVKANGIGYWANCAWDSLGIPAALGADAEIDAYLADSGEAVQLAVKEEQATGYGTAREAVVHISLPFARWYDDLVYT